ncbi:hypothetical protein [Haliangium sp.]|uniref:monooxygenase n=1 Tax=Haliangium sp. TaxID=2663208 RepID=UPI003D0A7AD6
MRSIIWLPIPALLAISVGACIIEVDTEPDTRALSFWQDVAPIYYDNCVTCHQNGGVAPFALDNYEDAKRWARPAQIATEQRIMPPWLVTDDGSCGDFADSRWLSERDIATIAAWVEQGAREGTPRTDLTVPAQPALEGASAYTTPTFVPEVVSDGPTLFDEYRCFVIDPALGADTYITGYEVVPGTPAIVHHVLAAHIDPDQVVAADGTTNRELIHSLDAASPDRDGWPCYGLGDGGIEPLGLPVTWAPGMGVVEYPTDTGVRAPKNSLLVVQIHYNLANEAVRGLSDSTTIKLRYRDRVEREGLFELPDGLIDAYVDGQPVALPPGQDSFEFTWEGEYSAEMAALGVDHIDLYGVFPHMHERGRSWQLEIERADGSRTCAGEVESWDFDWQFFYFYRQPIRVEAGDTVRVTCRYDTRGADAPILPGWGTQDEMCVAGLYLVMPE